jgi:hypothetical protein
MPLKIVGVRAGRRFSDTRIQPASAAVLALNWIAQGVQDVMIEADRGFYSVSEFQKRFLSEHKAI